MGAGMLPRTVRILAVVSALLALAACTAGSDGAPGPDASPTTALGLGGPGESTPGMRATVVQQRADVGTTRIGLEVTTDRRTTVHVSGVQLVSDAFEEQPVTPKDTDFTPGRTIDLTVDYGTPVCTPDVSVDDAQVVVHYVADGGDLTATLPVARLGRDLLSHLHTAGCARQRLDQAASLTYVTPFHRQVVDGELSLVGALRLQRPPDGGSGEVVVIESVFGSVLFEFAVGAGPAGPSGHRVGVLGRDQRATTVPVLIRGTNRCDPHERSASQQTFIFTADVRVGSGRVHREIIEPPTRLRVQAMALLDDVCG